jgi:hypothetical protein
MTPINALQFPTRHGASWFENVAFRAPGRWAGSRPVRAS